MTSYKKGRVLAIICFVMSGIFAGIVSKNVFTGFAVAFGLLGIAIAVRAILMELFAE